MTAHCESDPVVRRNMPELDTLRGLAVLFVFLYHGLFWSIPGEALTPNAREMTKVFRYGWSGVQLFFVLSGFLITTILIRARDSRRYYRNFYIRRALRILPAFLLLVAALFATRLISWKYLLVSIGFAANLSPLLGITMEYPPLWSLAVEEHFYAVWPALVRRLSTRAIASIAVLIVLAGPVARGWAFSHGDTRGIYFYSWFNLDGLAAGALLAVIARHGRRALSIAATSLVSLAAVLSGAAGIAHAGITTRSTLAGAAFQSTLLYLVYGALLSIVLLAGSSRLRRFVTIAPLQWLGYISYGLYLVHVACFGLFDRMKSSISTAQPPYGVAYVLLRFAIAGCVAIAIATVSRRYFEGYFLSLKGVLTSGASSAADKAAPESVLIKD